MVRARAVGPRARLRAGRQGAQRRLHAGRGDGHDAARSTSGRSARSSAPTCTSRRSAATGCRWPPASRRCGSSSATVSSITPRGWAACFAKAWPSSSGATRWSGDPRQRADDRDRARRAELARRADELAPDPHGERGPVPSADRDPAAPRPRRDHDGGRQERRDQAAAAADALRAGGRQLPGGARRGPGGLPSGSKNWGVVRDIATATLRRRKSHAPR